MGIDLKDQTPKQQAGLAYGGKLRQIRGLSAYVGCRQYTDIFLPSEIRIVTDIAIKAEERARKQYDEEVRRIEANTNTDSGAASEPRTYNGK